MIVVIDNYDSFTWNLVDLLRRDNQVVVVFRNDEISSADLMRLNAKGILISPGPGRPEDSGISPEVLRLAMGEIPILGVCLGHQLIGQHFGMPLLHGNAPVHGKTDKVFHLGEGIFAGLPNPFDAMRYHSLILSDKDLPKDIEVTAWTASGEVMGIQCLALKLEGVQFHPESILTESGCLLVENWVKGLGG